VKIAHSVESALHSRFWEMHAQNLPRVFQIPSHIIVEYIIVSESFEFMDSLANLLKAMVE
jgi:hypothetical protein